MRPCAGALSPADDAHREHDLEPIATHTHWPFIGYAQRSAPTLHTGAPPSRRGTEVRNTQPYQSRYLACYSHSVLWWMRKYGRGYFLSDEYHRYGT